MRKPKTVFCEVLLFAFHIFSSNYVEPEFKKKESSHKTAVFGITLENILAIVTQKNRQVLASCKRVTRHDLILPLPLKPFSLFPRGSSRPRNQSKTISGEKMLVNTTTQRIAMEKVDNLT